MPRYYFHVHGPRDRLNDEEGVVLPDVEAAWYQAVRSARELIRADLRLGCGFEEQAIEIADDKGRPLDQLRLRDVARYAM
ncbi:MAG: hypothetical protein JO013_07870 [Alphaproteobacteria bacterium]|nr:hypothetical protein [Alphaproteobacteria bacterium]